MKNRRYQRATDKKYSKLVVGCGVMIKGVKGENPDGGHMVGTVCKVVSKEIDNGVVTFGCQAFNGKLKNEVLFHTKRNLTVI